MTTQRNRRARSSECFVRDAIGCTLTPKHRLGPPAKDQSLPLLPTTNFLPFRALAW
jgi:hypothetical protein